MLFVVRPEDHLKVLAALNELLLVPMQFDWGGTEVIFKDAPRYSQTAHQRRDYTRYIVGENGEIANRTPPALSFVSGNVNEHEFAQPRTKNDCARLSASTASTAGSGNDPSSLAAVFSSTSPGVSMPGITVESPGTTGRNAAPPVSPLSLPGVERQ